MVVAVADAWDVMRWLVTRWSVPRLRGGRCRGYGVVGDAVTRWSVTRLPGKRPPYETLTDTERRTVLWTVAGVRGRGGGCAVAERSTGTGQVV